MYQDGALSAAQRYGQLEAYRHTYLERARRASELTIPTLVPPAGHGPSTIYPTPYQAIGARGVNNLASRLLLALLPPNSPFFRLTISEYDLEKMGGKDKRGLMEEVLSRMEREVMTDVENSAMRVPVFEALKHLLVAGNVLLYLPDSEDGMRVFRLDRYVVKRDSMGNVLEILTKETVSPMMLPDSVRGMLSDPLDRGERNYDLFTYVCRKGDKWMVHQEVEGIIVPDSEGVYPLDKCPFIALRFTRIDGEDYGRGYVEEYLGDLVSLEELTKAIVQGSAAAAKVLFLVRPNGSTKIRNIAESSNGAVVSGDAQDVSVLQLQKFNDFRVAQDTIRTITERLGFAFLMHTSVQRDAERVTAEEVRFMAQELETALGGVYSILSQEFQMPVITLVMHRLTRRNKLPKLPKGAVKPQIVTGLEALGRGQDLNKLATFLKYLQPLGPEIVGRELNVADYIDRLGASLGIETNGLVKSEEQKAQEQAAMQQMQQQQMMMEGLKNMAERAAPNVVNAYTQMQGNKQ